MAAERTRPATAILEAGLRCRIVGQDVAVVYTDMPVQLGGGASAPSPGWLARAAQASCEAAVIAMRAAALEIVLERLEVNVSSLADDHGFLGLDESVPPGPTEVSIQVRIAGDAPVPQLRELVEWADRHSAVSDTIRRSVPTELEFEAVQMDVTQFS